MAVQSSLYLLERAGHIARSCATTSAMPDATSSLGNRTDTSHRNREHWDRGRLARIS